jgi:hypothetical protein
MSEAGDVLTTVDAVLGGKELRDSPRAFLLVRLCQLSLLFAPDRTEDYWSLLAPLQTKTPQDAQSQLGELREMMEAATKAQVKGFAAEVIADVEAAKELAASDVDAAKQRLSDCETALRKRRWPFGKGPAWIALIETWATIDRRTAFRLVDNMPGKMQESFVQRMNQANPLAADEWEIVAGKVGMAKAVKVVLEILDTDKPQLQLPQKVMLETGTQIRKSLQAPPVPKSEEDLLKALVRYAKLMGLQVGGPNAHLIPALLKEMYTFLATTNTLDQVWPARFTLLRQLMDVGVTSASLTQDVLDELLKKTPRFLTGFVQAHFAAALTPVAGVEGAHQGLLAKTGQDPLAEAWFLATVAKRGAPAEAISVAEKSARAQELLPRLRRAWVSLNSVAAGAALSVDDMAGDPIGEFLVQGDVPSRVAYLKQATGGTRSVPGAMWAGAGTEEEPEGLRGFFSSLTAKKKTHDEIIHEYLTLNPLYSSYRRDTPKEKQFAEYLRMHGYGEYQYTNVDNALLETLVAWGDQEPAQVRSVLRAMWQAIQPDDQILMVDWLRNALLTRCRNVFSADPQMFEQDYLGWFTRELVKKGRVWRRGNTQITLKFPDTATFQFCVASAAAVSGLSPSRRDQILLSGLSKFKAAPPMVEVAAQLYNADKGLLDLTPPAQLKPNLVEAWQLGIVKAALQKITLALIARAGA